MPKPKRSADVKEKAARGRPSIYSGDLADKICMQIAFGNSVRKICAAADMPNEETVYRWILNNEEFSKKYRSAREVQQERHLDEIIEIADEQPPLNAIGSTDTGAVQRAKLRIDTRKWAMARLAPKRYGTQADLSQNVESENALASLIRTIYGTSLPVVKDDN